MSLPLQAIDRLFDRLGASYGSAWMRQWEGVDANAVKSVWAHELSGYAGNLKAIAWALENLPERCPNVIEFRNLCRRAPALEVLQLPGPKADLERLSAEVARLAPLRSSVAAQAGDWKGWAHRLKARHDAGEKLHLCQIHCFQAALGIA